MGDIDVEERCEKYRAEAHLLTDERDAALAELARLRSVVAGVEALAEKLEAEANAMCPSDDWPSSGDIAAAPFSDALRLTVRRLRSVLSDTRQEQAQ